jgi:hypothetical protein
MAKPILIFAEKVERGAAFAAQWAKATLAHTFADAMCEKPRRFVGNI